MGSGHSCLSNGSVHHSSEEDAELIRVVRSTDGELFQYPGPVFVKDLMSGFQGFAVFAYNHKSNHVCDNPLHPDTELLVRQIYHLKPLLKPSIKQADSNLCTHMGSEKGYKSLPEEEISVKKPEEKSKVKKVRFADEAILSSSSDNLESLSSRNGCQVQELFRKKQSTQINEFIMVRASYVDAVQSEEELSSFKKRSSYKVKEQVVRLKVVISKKELTELMSPKTTESQAHALVQKMIFQSSCNKSEASQYQYGALISPLTWRPSLEHIPEDT